MAWNWGGDAAVWSWHCQRWTAILSTVTWGLLSAQWLANHLLAKGPPLVQGADVCVGREACGSSSQGWTQGDWSWICTVPLLKTVFMD